jgi:hypothetical protein
MVRLAMLAESVGWNGRDSCLSGLSFGSAIYLPPVFVYGAANARTAPVDLGPIRVAKTFRHIVRLGRQFRHQNDAGDKRCEETRQNRTASPSTGAVIVAAKPLVKLDLSLLRFGAGNKSLAKTGILGILSPCRNALAVQAERQRRQERMKERAEPLKLSADNLEVGLGRGIF